MCYIMVNRRGVFMNDKQITGVRALTFGALITALHIVALLIMRYSLVPGLDIAFFFILPFFSAMYSVKCPGRNVFIMALSTLAIAIVIDLPISLMPLLPSLVVGIAYGILTKLKVGSTTKIYALTVIELGLFFLDLFLVTIIDDGTIVEILNTLFNTQGLAGDFDTSDNLGTIFIVVYCFAEAFLMHFILKNALKRMKVKNVKDEYPPIWIPFIALAGFGCSFIIFESEAFNILMYAIMICFALPVCLYGYQSAHKPAILYGIFGVQTLVFLAAILPLLFADNTLTWPYFLLLVPPFGYALFDLFTKHYFKKSIVK